MKPRSNAKEPAIERRPVRMLKEFLRDDDSSTNPTFQNQQPPMAPASLPRSRSRSRAAAEAAISSFQKLIKSLHIIAHSSSSPSPPPLPRSLSKRLLTKFRRSSKKSRSYSGEGKIIKVKDILRWRSFRDEDTNKSPPSAAASTTSGGKSSDFRFTADELPCRWGKGKTRNDDVDVFDGGDQLRETTGTEDGPQVGPEEDNIASDEEKEQHSPISVLNSPFRDEASDEEFVSSFDQSLANVERTKQSLLQRIQWLESLAGVDEQSVEAEDHEEEIKEEKGSEAKRRDYMFKVLGRLSRGAQGVNGKEECIREMERQGQWSKFSEEREEVGEELEACLLHDLVDEVLLHLFGGAE